MPQPETAAPVFFACHDEPAIIYQSPNLASFLYEAFRTLCPPHDSLLNQDGTVWKLDAAILPYADALASGDPLVREFAQSLPDTFRIADLRQPEIGAGFSWATARADNDLRRHGTHRLFAINHPPRKPSLFARLFQR